MNCRKLLLLPLLVAASGAVHSQVDGFWLVTKVTVGDKLMTPVAKWVKMQNGKAVSGNGWQQHTEATYHWDRSAAQLSFENKNEPLDEFGAFHVSFSKGDMTWSRMEEGDPVTVSLTTITELPASPADNVKGLWSIRKATHDDKDVLSEYDPGKKMFLFVRWDRVFVWQRDKGQKQQGYWFMNGHRPELKLLTDDRERDETWTVSFEGNTMSLAGMSENVKNRRLEFVRLKDFPK